MPDLLVVGTGLIGTSVALALRGARDVVLTDRQPASLERALSRGAGRRWDGEPVALALVCVPVAATAAVLTELQRRGVAGVLSHVASAQVQVQRDVEAAGVDVRAVCGGHPMAGRETAGPDAARADLFDGRPWAICPTAATAPASAAAVGELARDCGAEPVVLDPQEHDDAVALVSHLPQVAASAVAAQLLRAPRAARLAGPGLADTTRVAGSPPELWLEVLRANGPRVAPVVRGLARDLLTLAEALETATSGPAEGVPGGSGAAVAGTPAVGVGVSGDAADDAADSPLAAVRDLLERGNAGRALVPRKRGRADRDFLQVVVDVPDRPGQLAGLFASAAAAGVNVEDVRVDHAPGRPRGRIELAVAAQDRDRLAAALTAAGFVLD